MIDEYIRSYAFALFLIAKEDQKLKLYKQEALMMINLFQENDQIIKIFNSSAIKLEEKIKIIKKTFISLDPNFINFLLLLVEKKHFAKIITILNLLINNINKEFGIEEGVIYSTYLLSPSQLKSITQKISKKTNKKVFLINKIDHELISGFRVVLGDMIIEDSFLLQIEQLKLKLLKTNINVIGNEGKNGK